MRELFQIAWVVVWDRKFLRKTNWSYVVIYIIMELCLTVTSLLRPFFCPLLHWTGVRTLWSRRLCGKMILKAVLFRAHKHERFNHFREILSGGTDRSSPTVSWSAMSGCAEDQQSLSIMKSAATEATSVTNTIQDRTDATGDTPDES